MTFGRARRRKRRKWRRTGGVRSAEEGGWEGGGRRGGLKGKRDWGSRGGEGGGSLSLSWGSMFLFCFFYSWNHSITDPIPSHPPFLHPSPSHLAKAALPQDGQEGEVTEFDLVQVVGRQVSGAISLRDHLLTWTQFGFLHKEEEEWGRGSNKISETNNLKTINSVQLNLNWTESEMKLIWVWNDSELNLTWTRKNIKWIGLNLNWIWKNLNWIWTNHELNVKWI